MLFKKRIQRSYVSDLDGFLFQFDQEHANKSASQQAEITKSEHISYMRDTNNYETGLESLWENF